MTRIFSEFETKHLDNDRFVQMTAPFSGESDELKKAGLKSRFTIPKGFTMDGESVPAVRGRNVRGGGVHDYFSCFDSDPVCPTQALAANVYLEFNAYCDDIDAGRSYYAHAKDFLRRWAKWSVVYIWPGFFHQRSVLATCKELYGFDGDPYITVEELQSDIKTLEKQIAYAEEVKQGIVESSSVQQVKNLDAKIDVAKEQIAVKETKIEKISEQVKDAKADAQEKVEVKP